MPIYLVKQTFTVEVVNLVPAADEKAAESANLNRFAFLIMGPLLQDKFIVTRPDTLDVTVNDIDSIDEYKE